MSKGECDMERKEKIAKILGNQVAVTQFIYQKDFDITNGLIEAVQKIDNSYTAEEIKDALQFLYQQKYRYMIYNDFLVCLSLQNAKIEDYEYISYSSLSDIADILMYYDFVANTNILKLRQNLISYIQQNIVQLAYNAYKSVAKTTAVLLAYENAYEVTLTLLNKMIENKINSTLAKEIVEELFNNATIEYEGGFPIMNILNDGILYDKKHMMIMMETELLVIFWFNDDTIQKANEKLQNNGYQIRIEDIVKSIFFDEDEYDEENNSISWIEGNPFTGKSMVIRKTIEHAREYIEEDFEELKNLIKRRKV